MSLRTKLQHKVRHDTADKPTGVPVITIAQRQERQQCQQAAAPLPSRRAGEPRQRAPCPGVHRAGCGDTRAGKKKSGYLAFTNRDLTTAKNSPFPCRRVHACGDRYRSLKAPTAYPGIKT